MDFRKHLAQCVPYTGKVLIDETDYLEGLAEKWRIALPTESKERLFAFVSRMMEWNARINLTGAKSRDELVSEHLVDSFAMTYFLPGACTVADVGAGGGLPGVPLAILRPDISLAMVEPRAKRVAFLRSVTHELGLRNSLIHRCRCDDLRATFDVSASRATFPPEEWLRVGRGLVRVGGSVLLFANQDWSAVDPSVPLRDSVSYTTGSGRPRWMGAFCFT